MKKLIVLLGSLSLLAMPLTGCGGDSKDKDDPIVPDSGPVITDGGLIIEDAGEDAGPTEIDAAEPEDAGEDTDAAEPEDAGEDTDASVCVPRTEEEAKASACSTGALNAACGPKTVPDGCGGEMDITCGCTGELKCESDSYTCVEECVPLNSNTGNAYYCNHAPNFWECGGKIERDDLCGGKVMVNCGGDTACKGGKVCDTDPDSDSYLHCVMKECVPEAETDAKFCERYHSECGTADGEDSCSNVKHVNCGGCTGTDICVSQMVTAGSGTYLERSCEPRPTAINIEACVETAGDTSAASGTSSVMLVEKNGEYLYAAPEIVYAFKASAAGEVTVSATPWNNGDYDLVLYVVDDLASRTPIKLADSGKNGDGEPYGAAESLTFTATQGTTYYLVVDGGDWSSHKYDRGPFHITVDDGSCSISGESRLVFSAVYAGGKTGETNNQCKPTTQGSTTLIGSSSCEVYHQDYIELHNAGTEAIDVSGRPVFVSPIDSNKQWVLKKSIAANKTIPAGGFFLIGERSPDANNTSLGDDIQDIPAVDLNIGKDAFQLSGNGHKILIGACDDDGNCITADDLNKAKEGNTVVGTACPTAEQGLLFVFGQNGVCGTSNAAPQANQLYYSADGCSDMELTDFTVEANPVTDAYNNTTHPITSISPTPRNSKSAVHICGD